MGTLRWVLVASALAWTGSAQADCKDDLDEVQEQARELELDDAFRQQLRQLHRSALLLADNGEAELCEEVAESMEDMVARRERQLDRQARLQALRQAPPIAQLDQVLGLDSLVDSTVYDAEGEELGTLSTVIVNPATGKVAYGVLEYGGFLGFGEKRIPIPLQRLRLAQERGMLVLDIPRDTLDQAQGLERKAWPLNPPLPGTATGAR